MASTSALCLPGTTGELGGKHNNECGHAARGSSDLGDASSPGE